MTQPVQMAQMAVQEAPSSGARITISGIGYDRLKADFLFLYVFHFISFHSLFPTYAYVHWDIKLYFQK